MKKLFLVESDTNYSSLFCYELVQEVLGTYTRGDAPLFNNVNREQFFGNLSSLCRTHEDVNAPKITLKPSNLALVPRGVPTSDTGVNLAAPLPLADTETAQAVDCVLAEHREAMAAFGDTLASVRHGFVVDEEDQYEEEL